jgi:hypothetical protein
MGHEPGDTAVAVGERVNPQKTVRRRRQNGFGAAEGAIDLFEPGHEARHGAGTYREVLPDFHVVPAEFARHGHGSTGIWIGYNEQFLREQFAEAPVNLARALNREGAAFDPAFVNPPLDGDVRLSLDLQGCASRDRRCNRLQCPFDVDRMGVMTLYGLK